MMKKWEYMIAGFEIIAGGEHERDWLRKRGNEGWELASMETTRRDSVGIPTFKRFYFKQEIELIDVTTSDGVPRFIPKLNQKQHEGACPTCGCCSDCADICKG